MTEGACVRFPLFVQCEYFAPVNPATGGVYCNFWGFSPVGYMAPMARFSANPGEDCGRGVVREARSPPSFSSLCPKTAPPCPVQHPQNDTLSPPAATDHSRFVL